MDPRTARLLNLTADPAANENALKALRPEALANDYYSPAKLRVAPDQFGDQSVWDVELDELFETAIPPETKSVFFHEMGFERAYEIADLRAQIAVLRAENIRLRSPPKKRLDAIRRAVADSDCVALALQKLRWPIHTHSYRRLERIAAEHKISTAHFVGKGWRGKRI